MNEQKEWITDLEGNHPEYNFYYRGDVPFEMRTGRNVARVDKTLEAQIRADESRKVFNLFRRVLTTSQAENMEIIF